MFRVFPSASWLFENNKIYLTMRKKMTPKEYAQSRAITLSAVTKQLRKGAAMPNVLKIEKFGRFYILTVDTGILVN